MGTKQVYIINYNSSIIFELKPLLRKKVNLFAPKDVKDAFSVIAEAQISACLIDLNPVEVNPLEFIKYLKSQANHNYPVFIYTKEDEPHTLFKAGKLGADGYFKCPEDTPRLAEILLNLPETNADFLTEITTKTNDEKCPKRIRLAVTYALNNFPQLKRARDICRILSVSYPHFCRQFKQWTGHKFWGFVTAIKIGAAKRLLKEEKLYVKEIAFKVGFESYGQFLRAFKRSVGVTPKEYQNFKENIKI